MLYRRNDNVMVNHLETSAVAERAWYSIHSHLGPILLGVWYRPPNAPHEHMKILKTSLNAILLDASPHMLLGI